ncbi:protein-disulfide reductase DsbD [Aquabacterium sp. OR-4]|uniref:protein-disulfide reductase DsbD n=1 Tax=Aquabacterium sp. OR-4 TaxID=2978127 RepID=UPI0028C9F15C|nr:protein-disulfide reductase DsbD [Aquabacterium sp. OR-4]MDT7834196.1 protein-disulfide reductase DsbD [Aquabacterium sp. OR-4]
MFLVWLLGLGGVAPAKAAEQFLAPEQAFQVSAALVSAQRAEVLVRIAEGYYLYREPLKITAEGAALGPLEVPAGKVKFDENFGKEVETYRGELQVGVPLQPAGSAPVTLEVVVQGCADAGLCYPPQALKIALDASRPTAGSATTSPAPIVPNSATASQGNARGWLDDAAVGEVLRSGRLWPALLVFFGLGLMLSLTPCVLPMLPILSSLIVGQQPCASRGRGLALATAYSLGMALVYTALGIAAGLAGEGFAAALQTPWALGVFSALLVVLALSMFDVYELRLPAAMTTQLTVHCNRLRAGQLMGVFAMGGVSALIVSPCVSAPLAGALMFISQSRDVVLGGGALFALAMGMSVPLLLLGASAGRWLPKAGPWMQMIKRLFGVLMLAVALWVAQPLLQVSVALAIWGLLLMLLGFLLKPFAPHAAHQHPVRDSLGRAMGLAALAWGLAQLVGAASGGRDPLQPLAHLVAGARAAEPAAPAFRVIHTQAEFDAALRDAGGQRLILDFYADWCVSCKEMERFTFRDANVAQRMQAAVLIKADVTANTEDQRAMLKRFGLFGPPGTLFFDGQGRELLASRVIGYQDAARFKRTLDAVGL